MSLLNSLEQKLSVSFPVTGSETPKQPDIEYHPNRTKWQARTARRLVADASLPTTPLPTGFPTKLSSLLVWEGKDWKDEKEWVYELNAAELDEIDNAVKHFHGLNKPLGLASPSTFPLPTLGNVLSSMSREVHIGRGFSVLRGIPVSSYSREDNILIYSGISSYIAPIRGLQDINGGVLNHIKDLSHTYSAEEIGAPSYTADKQVFHTDKGDIVALFALEIAAEGGASKVSSSWQVYNDLAENRPDLIETLAEPWPFENFNQDSPYTIRPLLFHVDNKIIIQYARRSFTGFQGLPRSPNIPPITEAQAEALDSLHFLAEKYALTTTFQKGDIQYINNLSIFHARDGFRNDAEHTRHLLRLWLRNEELAWKIPSILERQWERLYYSVTPEQQRFPLEPQIRSESKGLMKHIYAK